MLVMLAVRSFALMIKICVFNKLIEVIFKLLSMFSDLHEMENCSITNFAESNIPFIDTNAGTGATKQWKCAICQKSFKHQYVLTRHMPIHTGERKYQCDICEKSFRQLSTLSQHKASKHSALKPYVCEMCTKSFSRLSILINHKKIHNEEKLYKCNLCNSTFHQKSNLEVHKRVHGGTMPHICPNCSKHFNKKSDCNAHRKGACKPALQFNVDLANSQFNVDPANSETVGSDPIKDTQSSRELNHGNEETVTTLYLSEEGKIIKME